MSSDANARDGADRKPNGGSAERGKGDGKQRDAKFYDARKERQAGQESATHPKAAASAGGGAAEDGWSSVSRSRAEPKATKQPEGGAGRGGAKSGARGGGAIGAAWAGRGGNVEAGAAPPRKEGPDSEKPANKTRPATAPPGRGRGDATRDSGQGRVGDAGGRGRGRGGPSSGADAPAGDGHFARTEWLALSPGWFPLCGPGVGAGGVGRGRETASEGGALPRGGQDAPAFDLSWFPDLASSSAGAAPMGAWAGRTDKIREAPSHQPVQEQQEQQQRGQQGAAGGEGWTKVVKQKTPGMLDLSAVPASWAAASAPGDGKRREVHGALKHKPGKPDAGRGPPESIHKVGGGGKKAPILLSDLFPQLQSARKKVSMPVPYTVAQGAVQSGKQDGREQRQKSHMVMNPNAADGNRMIVLHRKEKEGGKKKNKLSPLKKLILKDRAVSKDRQAAAAEAVAAAAVAPAVAAAVPQPVILGADGGGVAASGGEEEAGGAGAGGGAGEGGEAVSSEETAQALGEWFASRGLDLADPAHVQELLRSLNEEDDEEEEDEAAATKASEARQASNQDEGAACLSSGVTRATLPSVVTWNPNYSARLERAVSEAELEDELDTEGEEEEASDTDGENCGANSAAA
ncbi:hypothetical protein T484DRAFT_1902151, partial [Baffinella frigidus]